jgi:hypothetical protein
LFVSCLGFVVLVGGWGILPRSFSYVLAGCFMWKGVVLRIFHAYWFMLFGSVLIYLLCFSALCPWSYFRHWEGDILVRGCFLVSFSPNPLGFIFCLIFISPHAILFLSHFNAIHELSQPTLVEAFVLSSLATQEQEKAL